MPELLTDPTYQDDRAAAMARHPASLARSEGAVRLAPEIPPPLPFAGVVDLLTGLWREADPEGFAVAMTAAPVIAGHAVLDLAHVSAPPPGPVDPRSAALLAALDEAVWGVLRASELEVDWVAAAHAGHLYVEARARLSPAAAHGREAFLVAHAVEFVGAGARAHRPAVVDHSWAVLVLGDGRGGVAGIVRATLFCPSGCCPGPGAGAGFALSTFRQRLIAPALAAHGFAAGALEPPPGGVVLPFRRRQT